MASTSGTSAIRGAKLSTRNREIVRACADGDSLTKTEKAWLVSMGLAFTSGKLTKQGKRVHNEIMQSGDGPESLKEFFSF